MGDMNTFLTQIQKDVISVRKWSKKVVKREEALPDGDLNTTILTTSKI